jgi:hypothetical protein
MLRAATWLHRSISDSAVAATDSKSKEWRGSMVDEFKRFNPIADWFLSVHDRVESW